MAPHSSTLAWKIPWTEEPGGLLSVGSLRVGYDWATSLWLFTFMHWRRKWQPTPVFLPGQSQGRGSLVGCRLRGRTESDTTEATWQQQQQQCFTPLFLITFWIFKFSVISEVLSQNTLWATDVFIFDPKIGPEQRVSLQLNIQWVPPSLVPSGSGNNPRRAAGSQRFPELAGSII